MPAIPRVPAAAREAILAWYRERGRPLAFRRTSDPYAILVSEAMAQQTQAARAAAYWEQFIERFPTSATLAAASPADVLRAWQGLGYDRRALALRRAAIAIETDHGGRVPESLDALRALPGVGPYTARAVAALAFGRPVGAVDVNVRRVLGRIAAGDAAALGPAALQDVADAAVPPDRPGEWTHAVMDVGATVCRPRAPRCEACPARPWCRFAAAAQAAAPDRTAAPAARTDAAPRAGSAGKRQAHPSAPAALPFASTTRWLRGRILDRLRAVPDGAWVAFDDPIGEHDLPSVRTAVGRMAADGLLELSSPADGNAADTPLRARLPLA